MITTLQIQTSTGWVFAVTETIAKLVNPPVDTSFVTVSNSYEQALAALLKYRNAADKKFYNEASFQTKCAFTLTEAP